MGFFSKTPEDLDKALLTAVGANELATARSLVSKGARVNSGGENGPLYLALKQAQVTYNNYEAMVAFLLEEGANPNLQLGADSTLLMLSMETWRSEIAAKMMKHGADVNLKSRSGKTPLMRALEKRRTDTIRVMLEKGAEVNAQNPDGRLPLHEAVIYGSEEIVRQVLGKGADINAADAQGKTALHLAAERGYAAIVLRLLERGADATLADREMKTAASYADSKEFPGLAAVLRGEQPDARNGPPAGGWKLVAEDEIARMTPKNAIGYRVTEIFNFSARTYTQVMRNLDTGAESQSVKSFSSVSEGGLVDAAYAALERLGGKAPGRVPDKKKLAQPGAGA